MRANSMTGFGAVEGEAEGRRWRIEIKSVNGRSLDLRLRLADGFERLEADLRARAMARLGRGAVTASLKADDVGSGEIGRLDRAALAGAIEAAGAARADAEAAGLPVAPVAAERLLALPGVLRPGGEAPDEGAQARLAAAVGESFEAALDQLVASRAEEGARLAAALSGVVDRIEALTGEAEAAHDARLAAAPEWLAGKVAALQRAGAEADPDRLAQELALIAVKWDVREELDRLRAHVEAARALIAAGGAIGRRLDFLTQEFNREANTLCSKAASSAVTAAGLELKTAIDQMREQAANLE